MTDYPTNVHMSMTSSTQEKMARDILAAMLADADATIPAHVPDRDMQVSISALSSAIQILANVVEQEYGLGPAETIQAVAGGAATILKARVYPESQDEALELFAENVSEIVGRLNSIEAGAQGGHA